MTAARPWYVLSGATSDIGRAIAVRLANAGHLVAAIGRDEAALTGLREQAPAHIRTFCLDLLDDAAVAELAAGVSVQPTAALIHCAGVHAIGSIETAPVEDLDAMYRTNVRAAWLLTQRLIASLAAASGHVVFVNSSAALRAPRYLAGYAISRHGLKVLADLLREEVNERGIRVSSIYLGRTATRGIAKVFAAEKRAFDASLLLQPADIAETVMYLLSLPKTAEVVDLTIRPAQKSY